MSNNNKEKQNERELKPEIVIFNNNMISKDLISINKESDHEESKVFNKFYLKTMDEKHNLLKSTHPEIELSHFVTGGLDLKRANSMIENCIGIISLPIGLGTNFMINGKKYNIPMAIEEPSVIAAASSIAKLVTENGGFHTSFSAFPSMIGQIFIVDTNPNEMITFFDKEYENIINIANSFCQNMVNRGGGTRNASIKVLNNQINGIVSINLYVNVCESMGANIINTICEGVSMYLQPIIPSGRILMKILSNLCIKRIVTTEFKIPIKNLEYKNLEGSDLCYRIIKANEIAYLDKYRATTHNKGIMNGMDSVAIALGQDWRAIESSAHAFASCSYSKENDEYTFDEYKPLSQYHIIEINNIKYLYGSLKIPMSIGVVGGAIQTNPIYSNCLKILGNPSSSELAGIIASVGLANNLAAIRALVTRGIQEGHMGLHAKNIAIRAGSSDEQVDEVVEFMKKEGKIDEETAKKYIKSRKPKF